MPDRLVFCFVVAFFSAVLLFDFAYALIAFRPSYRNDRRMLPCARRIPTRKVFSGEVFGQPWVRFSYHLIAPSSQLPSFRRDMNVPPSSSNDEDVQIPTNPTVPVVPKLHTVTVCAVPPPGNDILWEALSDMRRQLKDPGYYRWPPHINLLYPFLKLPSRNGFDSSDDVIKNREDNGNVHEGIDSIVERLESATSQVSPFSVRLNTLGTFGGKKRGVLWLNPDSKLDSDHTDNRTSPLSDLQRLLEETFPTCNDQSQKGGFTPHMTLSHFPSLESAIEAKKDLERSSPFLRPANNDTNNYRGMDTNSLEFVLDRIYLLERNGDGGQFLRVADISLGASNKGESRITQVFDPPIAFPNMPTEEAEWVHRERMLLKSRRNKNRSRRGGKGRRRRNQDRSPRVPDTPEIIAQKRAERKAKKERLLQEQEGIEDKSQP